jgi:ribosomal protein L37AE/L43A
VDPALVHSSGYKAESMSRSYYCSRHNIDHRSYDCPACAREQQHEALLEAISKIGREETPEYTSPPPPPRYNCPNCPYEELERQTGYCPDCGTDLKGFWLKLEQEEQAERQKEEAERKRAFFLSDYSTYECPQCSKHTLKYEHRFCSGCGSKIPDQFWSQARAVREPVQRKEAMEKARSWWGGFMIVHILYLLPALVLVSMAIMAQEKGTSMVVVMSLIPLFNWLQIVVMKLYSMPPYNGSSYLGPMSAPAIAHFIPHLLVGWTIVGAIVGWVIAIRRTRPMKR